jgi:Rrf2 family protein
VNLQVSAAADYALRALLVLAAEKSATPVKARTIARQQQIPERYLWTILLQLRNAGILSSLRGNEGGYWLARDASEVSVADVMKAVDGPLVPKKRIGGSPPYRGVARHLGAVWDVVQLDVVNFLASVTLADVRDGVTLSAIPSEPA